MPGAVIGHRDCAHPYFAHYSVYNAHRTLQVARSRPDFFREASVGPPEGEIQGPVCGSALRGMGNSSRRMWQCLL